MEQNLRDARISTLYEGTSGIQALDLLARKVLPDNGETLAAFVNEILEYCDQTLDLDELKRSRIQLREACDDWLALADSIGARSQSDPNEVGAASFDFLMYSGYVTLAYFWSRSWAVSARALENGTSETAFYRGKVATARFYFDKLLPRTLSHRAMI